MINGIVALIGKSNVIPSLTLALKSISHRAWDGYRILTGDSYLDPYDFDAVETKVAIGCCLAKKNGKKPKVVVHGKVYHPKGFDFESSVSRSSDDLNELSKALVGLDGDFVFVASKGDSLICGRDPLGSKPLYIGHSSNTIGLASEIKALKSCNLEKIGSVRPGHIYEVRLNSIKCKTYKTLEGSHCIKVDTEEASEVVLRLLTQSIERRIEGSKEVAVGFSGGLDSSLLALLASRFAKIRLISAYTRGSRDESDVKRSAKSLGLEYEVVDINQKKINCNFEHIQNLVESCRIMDISIGLLTNFIARESLNHRCDSLFLGQLADELFGGYARYVRALMQTSKETCQRMLFNDIVNAYSSNLERDEKATSPYVNMILPYAFIDLVDYSLSLPLELKIDEKEDLRKIVLREAAVKAGLPKEIVSKPKKALQYSSGVQKLVLKSRNN